MHLLLLLVLLVRQSICSYPVARSSHGIGRCLSIGRCLAGHTVGCADPGRSEDLLVYVICNRPPAPLFGMVPGEGYEQVAGLCTALPLKTLQGSRMPESDESVRTNPV